MVRTATAAAFAVLMCAGTASAATPTEVVRQVMAAAPGRMPQSVRCVARPELLTAGGHRHRSGVRGVTIRKGPMRTVLLDWKEVCNPLHRFRMKRRIQRADVIAATMTVLHEKAHVNGVRTEWQANCWAIREVIRQFQRWGYNERQLTAVLWYVSVDLDMGRTDEYKVTGRCRL
jgi:hypothetical protein